MQREIKKEDGYFILNFGRKRKFPGAFQAIGVSNYALLRELYQLVYEKSMNSYVKLHFAKVDRSVVQLVKYYETIIEFLFGNDKHMGVYPIALKNYVENFGSNVDITELIPSVENLFIEGYRIKELNGKFYLVDASLKSQVELPSTNAASHIRNYDYMSSLTGLLNVDITQSLDDESKVAVLSFELAAEGEKKAFNVPRDYHNSLMGLNELVELDQFTLEQSKLTNTHASCVLRGKNYFGINISFIGQEARNYFWLLTDYAEHRIVHDLQEKHGFTFIQNLPTKYVVDHDGFLVSKVILLSRGMLLDSINYFPTPMYQAYQWLDLMSNTNSRQLRKELATFALLQLALGNNEVDESTFQVDADSRRITNYHHSGSSYVRRFNYKSVPNSMVKVEIDQDMSMMLELTEFGRMLEDIRRTNKLPQEHRKYFGVDQGLTIANEANVIKVSDSINISAIPGNIFNEESGVLSDIGRKIYRREVGLYNNWFTDHLKTSGVPEFSEPFLVLANRFALLATLAAQAKGII